MSGNHIEELLQQCLTAFDAGIPPEECLMAFPAARDELEPLFRQAISLRVAFAASPRPEFRAQARERFMFLAGKDVSAALSSQPDPDFVQDARQRVIRAAGADVQEALRDIPPPRLPFWVNARRRLLETAAQSQPAPRRAPLTALRVGLSAAVVAVALSLGGLIYINSVGDGPSGASAELAQLEIDLKWIEDQQKNGGIISPSALEDLSARTSRLLGQLDDGHPSPDLVDKLPELIDRQKTVVMAAANQGIIAPALAQVQTQELEKAEKVVEDIKQASALAPTATVEAAIVVTSTPETDPATPVATEEPSPTVEPTGTTEPSDPTGIGTGEVRVTVLMDDTFGNQTWKRIETANLSVSVPAAWQFANVVFDSNANVATFIGENLVLNGPDSVGLVMNVSTGQITALGSSQTLVLRDGGINGALVSIERLTEWASTPELAAELRHLLESLDLNGTLEPPPADPSATPPPETSATPGVSSSPVPTPTP